MILLGLPGIGLAHDARPISLEIIQSSGDQATVSKLKVPDAIRRLPVLEMPASCQDLNPPRIEKSPGATTVHQDFRCDASLQSEVVALSFPVPNPSLSTVIRVGVASGATYSTILSPSETRWQIPEEENAINIAAEYAWLGILHIWLGIDHLLFVLCLLFVAGQVAEQRLRRILVTITGFTVAHSITLVASALNLVYLPIPAVEAVIALSIVFLALEILRENHDSWTYRFPASVAISFGLLHGFGFASVLREIGLPQTELPVALLFFNLGVEIGQVAFVLLMLFLASRTSALFVGREVLVRTCASYLIGGLAAFWLIDRTFSFWMSA